MAVKRVIPPKGHTADSTAETVGFNTSTQAQLDAWFRNDVESSPEEIPTTGSSKKKGSKHEVAPTNKHTLHFNKPSDVVHRRQLLKDFKQQMRLLMRLRHPCILTPIGTYLIL